ncbi:UNVERIFIED_CONTAM: hypothetical protein K2H54_055070 [Gekko kuhli]
MLKTATLYVSQQKLFYGEEHKGILRFIYASSTHDSEAQHMLQRDTVSSPRGSFIVSVHNSQENPICFLPHCQERPGLPLLQATGQAPSPAVGTALPAAV